MEPKKVSINGRVGTIKKNALEIQFYIERHAQIKNEYHFQ